MVDSIKPKKAKTAGRPLGSRNKRGLIKAQHQLDLLTVEAVEVLSQIIKGDISSLGLDEDEIIAIKDRMAACKIVIDKAIANEKDKKAVDTSKSSSKSNTEEDRTHEEDLPYVSDTASETD
jgi:hypothetical protein